MPSSAPEPGLGIAETNKQSRTDRARLSGPGLRTFLAIAVGWGLSDTQQRGLLGNPAPRVYAAWCRAAIDDPGVPSRTIHSSTKVMNLQRNAGRFGGIGNNIPATQVAASVVPGLFGHLPSALFGGLLGGLFGSSNDKDWALDTDVLIRISTVLGIDAALCVLFANDWERVDWLRRPHEAPAFAGRAPLDVMTGGSFEGLLTVRRFLDAAQTGFYMSPNTADENAAPYDEADIVFR